MRGLHPAPPASPSPRRLPDPAVLVPGQAWRTGGSPLSIDKHLDRFKGPTEPTYAVAAAAAGSVVACEVAVAAVVAAAFVAVVVAGEAVAVAASHPSSHPCFGPSSSAAASVAAAEG